MPDLPPNDTSPSGDAHPVDDVIAEYLERTEHRETPEQVEEDLQQKTPSSIWQVFQAWLAQDKALRGLRNPTIPDPVSPEGDADATGPYVPNAPPAILSAGSTFAHFEIEGVLGEGGFGTVYKAKQHKPARTVALKVLHLRHPQPMDADARDEGKDRFEREVDIVARFQHPHIVQLYEAGEWQGRSFFSMQYIHGRSIRDEIRTQRIEGQRAARIAEAVADSLHYAHEQGIVHRDVKPNNLLLSFDGDHVWLLDFGLAKQCTGAEEYTLSGVMLGTYRYAPPEQILGAKGVDRRADVYSLGATLYHMVTGAPPIDVNSQEEALRRLDETLVDPRSRDSNIHRHLETIILRCLEKHPDDRYQDARALAIDLGRFIDGTPPLAGRIGPAGRLARRCVRKPLVPFLLLLLFLATVGGIGAVLWGWEQALQRASAIADGRDKEARARRVAERRLAENYLDRAQVLWEPKNANAGLLWLGRGLVVTPDDETELARVLRTNIEAWQWYFPRLRGIAPHGVVVSAAAFSADGERIVTVSGGTPGDWGTALVRVWDARAGVMPGRPVPINLEAQEVSAVSIGAEGTLIALAHTTARGPVHHLVRIVDAATGKPVGKDLLHDHRVSAVAISIDGKAVFSGCQDGTARLWNLATGEARGQPLLHAKDMEVSAVAISNDGKLLLTSGADKAARLFDAATGAPVGSPLMHGQALRSVAFSPSGNSLFTGGMDYTARHWHVTDVHQQRPAEPKAFWHRGPVVAIACSPDERMLMTGSQDGTAQLWDLQIGERASHALTNEGTVRAVAFSRDGRRLLTAGMDGRARLWERVDQQAHGYVVFQGAAVTSTRFSPDGATMYVASEDKTVSVLETATGKPARAPLKHNTPVQAVAPSPDGKLLVCGTRDGVYRWDVGTGNLIERHPPATKVWTVAFSPDGKTVLTGDARGISYWDPCTGAVLPLNSGEPSEVLATACSANGQMAIRGDKNGLAVLWDRQVADRSSERKLHHAASVWAVAFSPDGRLALTGSADGTARFWESLSGRPTLGTLQHRGIVYCAAFSPDGRTIATGCGDVTARLWDLQTMMPIGILPHAGSVYDVAFSPDGGRILTGGRDGTARLWTAPHPLEGSPERIGLWLEVLTGSELDAEGVFHVMDEHRWETKRHRLNALGGDIIP